MVFNQLELCNYFFKVSVFTPNLCDSGLKTIMITVSRHLFCHCSVCIMVGTWNTMVSLLHTYFSGAIVCRIYVFVLGMPEYASLTESLAKATSNDNARHVLANLK